MPELFAILVDIDTAMDHSDYPYFSKFLYTAEQKELETLGKAITYFLHKNRDFMVLHYTPEETEKLGYFEREDCLIFSAWHD